MAHQMSRRRPTRIVMMSRDVPTPIARASRSWHTYNLFGGGLIGYTILSYTVGDRFWPIQALDYVALFLLPIAFLLLPIALFRRRWGAALIQGACAVAFIWVVQGSHAANEPVAPPPGSTTITAMTYNIGNGIAPLDQLVPMLRESEADIVALQEVVPETAAALERDLADLFPYQVVHGAGIEGKALLSRFPITAYEWLEFNPGRPDLRAELDVDGETVVVIVAHPPPPELTWSGIQSRPGADYQLTSLIELVEAETLPLLLLGDLNITPMHDAYDHLTATGLQDTFRVAGDGLGFTMPARLAKLAEISDTLGHISVWPAARIDYIWVSPQWQPLVAWVGDDAGSDHLPVLATISLLPVEER